MTVSYFELKFQGHDIIQRQITRKKIESRSIGLPRCQTGADA